MTKQNIWFQIIRFCIVVGGVFSPSACGENIGTFWQVTDFHYDSNYSVGGNPEDMCHSNGQTGAQFALGTYGNYLCDAPWKLVEAAVEGMKKLQPNPDFILWTGDSIPHINTSEYDLQKNFVTIGNITDLLLATFPNVSFFPVLGNHDPYPQDQMPFASWITDGGSYYTDILQLSGWGKMIDPNAQKVFPAGGYYSTLYGPNLRMICLNTNLYYQFNLLTKDVPDPGFQLAWLDNQLALAKGKQEKVYIIAHIAPGAFELTSGKYFFYPNFNKRYLNIIERYSDIIQGQFYGHEHTDSFRVLFGDQEKPISQMFLSPAVTPWKKTNNPSIRRYHYDRDTGHVLDVFQYFLNLSEANADNMAHWKLEYQMTKEFGIPDVSPMSLAELASSFWQHGENFLKYLWYNRVSVDPSPACNKTCQIAQLCAISKLHLEDYNQCIGNVGPSPTHPTTSVTVTSTTDHRHHGKRPAPRYMFYVIGGLTGLVLLLFVVVAILCIGRRNHMSPMRYSRLPSFTPSIN
ncbi:acid sphingomyelinase-like phosphodiesterase 3b [Liolophura sinensis]|uniref:acid sphingomyelinase-like phosphodiesterase 3b n=1 Tax=Liolophura sinensis TaxID=3198878 RepID=UPI003158CC9D